MLYYGTKWLKSAIFSLVDYLKQYAYTYPDSLIAHEPVEPRDSSRLFVYDTKTDTVTFDYFYNIAAYLPGAVLVRNTTKVVPARLAATRENGEEIELFILFDRGVKNGRVEALVNQRVFEGERLAVSGYVFVVKDASQKQMVLKLEFSETELLSLLYGVGKTPVPPYIHSTLSEATLRERYQTIFAGAEGSVAAPTASLHFTETVEASLVEAHIETIPLQLNVGLGTFAPIFPENFTEKRLHHEHYEVSKESSQFLCKAKKQGRTICAVGTTVVRALESGAEQIMKGESVVADTDLFIYPPHRFVIPDAMITNFHVPRSSLLCLVDAFLEHKQAKRRIISLYETAIAAEFRLFSFGDSMLIL